MAQNTILAAATTAATSSDVTVAAGSSVNIGIFASGADVPASNCAALYMDTPGGDLAIHRFNQTYPVVCVTGPGTFRVRRPEGSVAIGAFSET